MGKVKVLSVKFILYFTDRTLDENENESTPDEVECVLLLQPKHLAWSEIYYFVSGSITVPVRANSVIASTSFSPGTLSVIKKVFQTTCMTGVSMGNWH